MVRGRSVILDGVVREGLSDICTESEGSEGGSHGAL